MDLMLSRGKKPRKGKVILCALCGRQAYKNPSRIRRNREQFCKKSHHMEWLKLQANKIECVICGCFFAVCKSQVVARNRKTCSKLCVGKLRTKRAEESRISNPPTEGALKRRIRYSKKMADWRIAVFERDDYTCQICSARSCKGKAVILNADHIKPFALYPESRFDITNGRTLCLDCHRKTPTWGRPKKSQA